MKKLLSFLITIAVLAPNFAEAALTDSLVSYWKLDESSGNASDSHGSNTLTNNGTTAYASGLINNGIDFEASGSNQYLSIADASQTGLDNNSAMSFSFWVKPESAPGVGAYFGVLTKDNTTPQRSYSVLYTNQGGTLQVWVYIFGAVDASVYSTATYSTDLGTGSWKHIVITFDGSQANAAAKLTLYVNDSSIAEASSNDIGGGATSVSNSSAAFELGRDGYNNLYWDGMFDEVGVWSRALTSGEVTSLYNSGAGLAYPFTIASASPSFGDFILFE